MNMDGGYRVRIGTKKDRVALTEFNQAMALETEGINLNTGPVTGGVNAVFNDENKGFYVVAEDEAGKVVGSLMIWFEWSDWRQAWFWWISSVYVLPEARQKQIYRKLYEFVKEKAFERSDVCGFRLYVHKDNKRAQKVYKQVGMKAAGYLIYEEEIYPDIA